MATHFLGSAEIRLARHAPLSTCSTRDDPDRVNDAWDVAQERQQNVEPELSAQADGEEHAHGRKQDCEQDTQKVCHRIALRGETMEGTAP